MSMNIFIDGEREIEVVKTGERETQTVSFQTWQTPTQVSFHIMEQPDRIQAYIDWALDRLATETVPVYAVDDIFEERDPVGYEDFNYGVEHVADLKEWISKVESKGYEVVVSIC